MTQKEILEQARRHLGAFCKGCEICNGKVCRNQMPGPGAKGVGDTAIRNYDKWKEIRVQMDTITENKPVDTTCTLMGKEFAYPFFAGPIGALNLHYGDRYTDATYNDVLVPACAKAGIAAFTGDGVNPAVMEGATAAIRDAEGFGVPTVKPWNAQTIKEKMELIRTSGAFAVAMDIDAAGLPFLKNMTPPAGSKSVEELAAIIKDAGVPFIIKGIMTAAGAKKALQAGAAGIVVSNHGGRVQDQCASTAEVLPEIVAAVGDSMTIFVDGGIRSGTDIFKALAMGADGVLVCRPFVTAVYGGEAEGVEELIARLGAELKDTMAMCGAHSLREITTEMIRR